MSWHLLSSSPHSNRPCWQLTPVWTQDTLSRNPVPQTVPHNEVSAARLCLSAFGENQIILGSTQFRQWLVLLKTKKETDKIPAWIHSPSPCGQAPGILAWRGRLRPQHFSEQWGLGPESLPMIGSKACRREGAGPLEPSKSVERS